MTLLLAMDRAPTVRAFDADGRLRIATSNISKANVCPYVGREIPNWQAMGLDGDRVYKLLRHPDELAKAAPTFNHLPVLSEHVPVTADDHRPELVVGSTGSQAAMDGAYLANSMIIWARPSIDGVVNNKKRQLSSAYRYRADMTPGNFNGIAYDGIMRDIIGNHVALVFEGRAGSDVIVGDELPMSFKSKRALMLAGGLGGLIRPLLAQDAQLDLVPVLADVNAATLAADGAPGALADKVYGIVQPLLAADAALELTAVQTLVTAVAGMALDGDDAIVDPVVPPPSLPLPTDPHTPAPVTPPALEDKPAMDEATVSRLIADATNKALAQGVAIRTAEREVQPVVGELVAMDSAADIYKAGLVALKVDLTGLPVEAYGATFRTVKAARDAVQPIAQDSRLRPSPDSRNAFEQRFPNRPKLIKG